MESEAMKPVDNKEEKKGPVVLRAVSHDEEGRQKVERADVPSRNIDTMKHIQRTLENKGVQRMERHPADGIGIVQQPPKSGHGGKYTWEGPDGVAEKELTAVPPAIDEKDPNYVDEEEEDSDVGELVVGEVEVARAAEGRKGVAELDPHLEL